MNILFPKVQTLPLRLVGPVVQQWVCSCAVKDAALSASRWYGPASLQRQVSAGKPALYAGTGRRAVRLQAVFV